jgi:hypothetical protein
MARAAFLLLCFAALAGLLAGCGESGELDLVEWPFMEKANKLSVNGKELNAFVASSELHRRRARGGLAVKEGEIIAYVYPKLDEPLTFRFSALTEPCDIVFVDASGKVLKVEAVNPFTREASGRPFVVPGARLVLQVPKGQAEKLELKVGAAAKTEPDLLKDADKAEPEYATFYFVRQDRKADDKPEVGPSVRFKVLETAEEVAQGLKDRPDIKDGEGVLILTSGKDHEFWLKGVEGPVSACYVSAPQRGGLLVSAMYEGIEGRKVRDLEQPVYTSPEKSVALLLIRGADFFTKNKIEARNEVKLAGWESPSRLRDADLDRVETKLGDRLLYTRVVRHDNQRRAALLEAPALADDNALCFDFDDPEFVEFDGRGLASEVELWFIADNGFGVAAQKTLKPGEVIEQGAMKHGRFVMAVPKGTKPDGLKFPYILRDLMPLHPTVLFYGAKDTVVTDRWPKGVKAMAHMELAVSNAEQMRGLMFRESLRKNFGMAFVYKDDEPRSYWMKNCRMDLSIAFINAKGVIVKIHEMKKPEPGTPDDDLPTWSSGVPARYAIEMEAGWFERNGIKEGDRVYLPVSIAPRE